MTNYHPSLLIAIARLALAGPLSACGPENAYVTSERPLLYVDDQHPTPAWIRKLRSQSLAAQREAFGRLSIADRIEFAAYEVVGEHPPLLSWMSLIARENRIEDVVPILRAQIENEPADSFVPPLVMIVQELSPLISSRELAEMERISRKRVARIDNFYLRFDAERTLDEIPKFVREYHEAHK